MFSYTPDSVSVALLGTSQHQTTSLYVGVGHDGRKTATTKTRTRGRLCLRRYSTLFGCFDGVVSPDAGHSVRGYV